MTPTVPVAPTPVALAPVGLPRLLLGVPDPARPMPRPPTAWRPGEPMTSRPRSRRDTSWHLHYCGTFTTKAKTRRDARTGCRRCRWQCPPDRRRWAGSAGRVVRRGNHHPCLLYTSDAADEEDSVDLGGRRI